MSKKIDGYRKVAAGLRTNTLIWLLSYRWTAAIISTVNGTKAPANH
jgi:hypothetical protein